jgi:predicted transcriptional regulator
MDRMTIALDRETRMRLRRIAADRGISMSAVIREAIGSTIERHSRKPHSLGIGASASSRTARLSAEGRAEPRLWR